MADNGGFGIDEVMRRLPHRYPFLLVDRVLECVAAERITAIKNVTANEEFFSDISGPPGDARRHGARGAGADRGS